METSSGNIVTPSGVVPIGCSGVPIAYSRLHKRVVFSCDDGSLRIADLEGRRIASLENAFVLQASSLEETAEGVWFYAFRPSIDEQKASLVRYSVITGQRSEIALGDSSGVDNLTQIELNQGGRCLITASRSGRGEDEIHTLSAYDLSLGDNIAQILSSRPQIELAVSPNEATGIGNPSLGFTRCIRDAKGDLTLLVTRIAPRGDHAVFSLEAHKARGLYRTLHHSSELWRIPWRTSASKAALIEATGELRIVEATPEGARIGDPDSSLRWLDYDVTSGLGVGTHAVGDRTELVQKRCRDSGKPSSCAVDIIERNVTAPYSTAVGAGSSGSIIYYDAMDTDSDRKYVPTYRWIF